ATQNIISANQDYCHSDFSETACTPLQGYGGYITLMMLNSGRLIRCAAAQAPIIDWTMYASAFSERYFGWPSTEESRYHVSCLC
ncbi:hypothetical protein AMECASPLE_036738, partial [Ameca splendens]